ncbi:hypothetical protein [Polymorphospora rubra]|uniref:DUF3558 domain-containing protein n=1 Tax=Polymorphospora rubra TaxID=338584 RepID=A0A810MW26_9ACTN|nr:hypothetical protein [Polymorphospora rubra]BCJ64760.1 hypothetical protein Prubr_17810 [Polymorphospora rubra]
MRKTLSLLGLTALVLTGALGCGISTPQAPVAQPPVTSPLDEPAVEPTPEEPPAAELPDPCALLPKAEAETLADAKLEDPVPIRDTCTYSGAPTGPTAQVEIYVGDGAKKVLDIDRELGHEFTALSGIGDEAHLENGMVFFSKGGVWVGIRLVRLTDDAENNKRLEQAARSAAGRL